MGLRERVEREGHKVSEYAIYARDSHSHLRRTRRGPSVAVSTPFPYTLAIDEGALVSILEEELLRHGHKVRRSIDVVSVTHTSPTSMTIHLADNASNTLSEISVRFAFGCDSGSTACDSFVQIPTTRHPKMRWVEADVSVRTDFEDIHRRCTIHSILGSCVLTPRPGGIKIQTQLTPLDAQSAQWDDNRMLAALQARVAATLSPYKLEFSTNKALSSRMTVVTKSLADNFANDRLNLFLLGPLASILSPLTRQCLNTGIMNAWNLCWKVALVLKGLAKHSILSTYDIERRELHIKAMEFDVQVDELFGKRDYIYPSFVGLHDLEEASGYTSGVGCRYVSDLVRCERRTWIRPAPEPITPGKRLLPATLIRHVDGSKLGLLEALGSDCRFKLLIFAGNLDAAMFHGLAGFLTSPKSPLLAAKTSDGTPDGSVDLFLIHALPHLTVSIRDLPQPYPRFAENIFEDEAGRWHADIGIAPSYGGICLVRPDGYVAIVSNGDDCESVTRYIEVMR